MSITFEGVSYSYKAPSKKRKKEEFVRKAQNGTTHPQPGGADWGNEPDSLWALKDISFVVEDGEFLGIAGHTGSGKSTLLQQMNGLIKPTEGHVLINGEDLADKKTSPALRFQIGLVMQYPEHQLFASSVYDDIAFGPRNLGLKEEEVKARVQRAFEQVGLNYDDLQEKSPFELSGGQQRRVALAGVLAMQPSTLVLDEPVAGLDPRARTELLGLIKNLHHEGITIVMVSHNMSGLAQLCDRILVLNQGRQFALGTPQEVFAHPEQLRSVGLDVPLADTFARSLRTRGIPLKDTLYDAGTLASDIAQLYQQKSF